MAVAERREVVEKLATLRGWLDRRGAAGVVLTRPGPVAWLSGGFSAPIERDGALAPLWLVVTAEIAAAVTSEVELPRIEAEEELPFELAAVPWYEPEAAVAAAEELAGAPRGELAADGHPAFADADDDLTALRLRLAPDERRRLGELGRDAAHALESALREWRPGERDLDVQARIAAGLERAGAIPAVLIVGGDDRVERYRHPLAIGAPVERLLMGVVVAQRGGLHVAATRFAAAGPFDEEPHARARRVEQAVLAATRPATTYGAILDALAAAYGDDAWRGHYQGGPIGYRQREFEIAPGQRESRWFAQRVEAGHAVAWNPSLPGGGKVEDTFLVEDDGLACVTWTGSWPAVEAGGPPRPAVLDVT